MPRLLLSDKYWSKLHKILLQKGIYDKPDLRMTVETNRELYRYRHLVENTFARLKHYRVVALRFDKLKRNYESVVAMACMILWLPM